MNPTNAINFILGRLQAEMPQSCTFHGYERTLDVLKSVDRLVNLEGISGEALGMLRTAAAFIDAGYLEEYDYNQEHAARLAREILPKQGYSYRQILLICGMLLSVADGQQPQNRLERLLCDANTAFLSEQPFGDWSDKLHAELLCYPNTSTLLSEPWPQAVVQRYMAHQYYTPSGKAMYGPGKLANLHNANLYITA